MMSNAKSGWRTTDLLVLQFSNNADVFELACLITMISGLYGYYCSTAAGERGV